MNFASIENTIRASWSEDKLKDKIKESRTLLGKDKFRFLDGPPFCNGQVHFGHLLVSSVKDTIARFKSQQGYQITYQLGMDTHGIPLEQEAEKRVGKVSSNDNIERIKEFNDECRRIISGSSEAWFNVLGQFGRQFERDQTYYTCSFEYMENLWGAMKSLWDKDLIYLSRKVMPYSAACETPLSNFEAGSNYKERTDLSVYVKFKLLNSDAYLVIWTTTPWSLVANQGICVNPSLEYCLVEHEDNNYWMTKSSISRVFSLDKCKIIKTALGNELVGLEYKPIFNNSKLVYKVYGDSYVKDETGTGLVHLAPLFGEDDYRVMKLGLEDIPEHLVDKGVRFAIDIEINDKNLKGTFVIDTALDITIGLKKTGIVLKSEKITHSYPHCWRTDTPLVYLACDAWFINVQKLIPELLENNAKINWYPKNVGTEKFANWIRNAPDWCISRNRVWGTPIPIWTTESGKFKCIGSVAELEELTGRKFTDLHLDHMDNVTFMHNGEKYVRTFGVLDCWFESGMAPIARTKDAFKAKEGCVFADNVELNVDFIAESIDQTRGWFYTLNVLSTALYNKPAFNNVIVSGLVLASDGKKMSKRLNNYTDPLDIMNKYGSDVLRMYLLGSTGTKAESFCFKDSDLNEISHKLITYSNAFNMYKDSYYYYSTINGNKLDGEDSTNKLDIWLINMFHEFRNGVYDNLESLELTQIPNKIYKFINKLCNTYIKLSRDRLKSQASVEDARESLKTLKYVLNSFNLVLVPFIPHLAEHFHHIINPDDSSIHLQYITLDKLVTPDIKIIKSIFSLSELFEAVRNVRVTISVPIIYPLNELHIYSSNTDILEFSDIIKKELNIKTITMMPLDNLPKKYCPNRGVLGKLYKKGASEVVKRIENGDISGLTDDHYNIEYIINEQVGFISSWFKYYSDEGKPYESIIYLSAETTPYNKMEAEVNHFRRQVNLLRKEMGLKLYDKVSIEVSDDLMWSSMDKTLIDNLRGQLGGNFTIVPNVDNHTKTITTLTGTDIFLRIDKL